MREIQRTLFFLVAVWLLTPMASIGAEAPRAERPTYTLGERWIRSDGVYDLIRIEDGRYIFAAGVDRQIHLTQDLMVAKVQKGQWLMEFDPAPKLTWPLEVGKWGTSSGIWRTPTVPGGDPVRFTWSVKAYEDVQVVAGTFKAFRISVAIDVIRGRVGWGPTMSPRNRQLVTWYAPEARQFVKAEGFYLDLLAFQVVALERPAPALLQVALQEPTNQAHCHHPGNRGSRQGQWRQGGDLGQRRPQWRGGLQARGATGTQERSEPSTSPSHCGRGRTSSSSRPPIQRGTPPRRPA